MKRVLLAVLVLMSLFFSTQAFAGPWAVVGTSPDISTTGSTTSIHTIDLGKKPPAVYGPFLEGQIITSTGDNIFDITLTKDKRYALASTFGTQQVHRIDLKNPKSPVIAGHVTLKQGNVSMFAEDIAMTPDGKLALVSDGGFSPTIAFIDVKNFVLTSMVTLTTTTETPTVVSAQAVAVAPDNKTVLFADYFAGKVHYGTINAARNGFDSLESIWLCDTEVITTTCTGNLARPVNVAISPDGKTALVAISAAGSYYGDVTLNDLVVVLEIKGPGNVVPGTPFFLHGLAGSIFDPTEYIGPHGAGNQSIAFADKKTAYVVTQSVGGGAGQYPPNQLSKITILGPGWAAVADPVVADLYWSGSSQLFGVDVLAITGNKAIAGHPTMSGYVDANFNCVANVDLKTGTTTCMHLNNFGQPVGIAIK